MTSTATGFATVGRDDELAALTGRLDALREGRGGLVLLCGEPGIGKSRLADDACRIASGTAVEVGIGRCQETDGAPPFRPWTQLLPPLLGRHAADEPVLTPLLDGGSGGTAAEDRYRLFDVATRTLVRASADRPLMIVLDDLHRADPASLALLRFVLPSLRHKPILVLGAYRPTEVPAGGPLDTLLGEAATEPGFELVELRGLTRSQVAELTRAAAVDTAPDALHELTGGNPFFLTEVLRLGPGRGVPATVQAAIRVRLTRLDPAVRELVATASVLGRDVDLDVLSALSGRAYAETAVLLSGAVRAGILTAVDGNGYRFEHILVQQVLYESRPAADLTRLHDSAVHAIARLGLAGDGSRLAHHACRATAVHGGRRRAVKLMLGAAREAAGRLAHEEATDWFTRALDLGVPEDDRTGLLLELADSAARAGRARAARAAYEQAWDRGARVRAALGLGYVVVSAGQIDAGLVRLLERTADGLGDDEWTDRVRVESRLAVELYWGSELPRARALAAGAVAAARDGADPGALGAALAAAQFVLRGPDAPTERVALGRELVDLSVRTGDRDGEGLARRMLIPELLQVDLAAAEAELDRLADLADCTGLPLTRWYVLVFRALRAGMSGRHDALELSDRAEELGRRVRAQPAPVYAMAQRFALRALLPVDQLEREMRVMVGRYPVLTAFRCQLAVLLAENGRAEESSALLAELTARHCAVIAPDSLWLANMSQLAETAALLGDRERAARLHVVLTPYADRIAVQGVPIWNGSVARVLGLTATTLGHYDEADAWFTDALRVHEAWGAAPLAERTRREHATMLRRRGGPGDRARAARLAGRPAAPAPVHGAGSLSAREAEVLGLLADGASNREIAGRLHLSVHTVERHVANVYLKTGARNRAEATGLALRARDLTTGLHGFRDPPDGAPRAR